MGSLGLPPAKSDLSAKSAGRKSDIRRIQGALTEQFVAQQLHSRKSQTLLSEIWAGSWYKKLLVELLVAVQRLFDEANVNERGKWFIEAIYQGWKSRQSF